MFSKFINNLNPLCENEKEEPVCIDSHINLLSLALNTLLKNGENKSNNYYFMEGHKIDF